MGGPPVRNPLAPRNGSRLGLSPWSRQRIGPVALAILEARAAEMDVTVSTVLRRDRQWMIQVWQGEHVTRLVARGPLEVCIAGALDDFEAAA